jgi:STE24 endopeptidase
MTKVPGTGFLIALAILASLILLLGYVPWSREGPPWRPKNIEASRNAERLWDTTTLVKGRVFRSNGYARYFRRKGLVGLILIAVLASGLHTAFRRLPPGPGVIGATLAVLVTFVLLDCVAVPFGLAALSDARAYGISKQSVPFWLADHYKGLGVSLVVSGLVVAALLFVVHRFPRTWPVWATLLFALGTVIMTLIVPLVIDPIFNKFTPLESGDLKDRFLTLAARAGVPAREVLISDASRRTTAVNAYFTGFGPTRRIVVYDTLVESLKPDEAGLVVAHEAGHWSLNHIVKGILYAVLGTGVALLLGRFFIAWVFRRGAFGIQGVLDPAIAPLLLLLYWFGTFVSLPIENAISRTMEREADQFALDLTGDAEAQVRTEVAIVAKNLDDVMPPPVVETLLYTHPPSIERVAQAERYAATRRTQLPEEKTP